MAGNPEFEFLAVPAIVVIVADVLDHQALELPVVGHDTIERVSPAIPKIKRSATPFCHTTSQAGQLRRDAKAPDKEMTFKKSPGAKYREYSVLTRQANGESGRVLPGWMHAGTWIHKTLLADSFKEESPMIANGISRQILVFSASVLLASGSALACGTGLGDCDCQTLTQAIAKIQASEIVDADGESLLYSQLQMIGDQDFMQNAMEDSAAKVLLGQLALKKSQRDDLKQFAQQLIQDQLQLSQQVLERVGKPLGVQEEKDISKKDKQLAARLAALSGAQFDEEYIKTMLKDQKQQLKRFGDETQLAVTPGVKIAAGYGKTLASQHVELLDKIAEGHSLVAENQTATIAGK